MKLALLAIFLALPIVGCKTVTGPPPPLAPGYTNSFDQSAGQALAAAHALVAKAIADYPGLTPAQQTAEKPVLNTFVGAVNTADSVYLAYHSGAATQAQVQTQLNAISSAQANFTAQVVH